jgi:hypothetical protein
VSVVRSHPPLLPEKSIRTVKNVLGILKKDKYPGAVCIEWEGKGDAVAGVKEELRSNPQALAGVA